MSRHHAPWGAGALLATLMSTSCNGTPRNEAPERPVDWSEETHGNDVPPSYELAFATDVVHTLTISIAPLDFRAMQNNLDELAPQGGEERRAAPDAGVFDGPFEIGPGPDAGPPPMGLGDAPMMFGPDPNGGGGPNGDDGPVGMGRAGGGPGREDPMYVPVDVQQGTNVWRHVGMRYKGNSSLASAARAGKPPFRLNFDKYEGDFPEIEDQRFFGFDELTFSANWTDDSMLRECFATELLRDRGVAAARCAFYRVFVDVGEGAEYWGLYSMLEDPSDGAMLDAQLGGREGNLYKPEGVGADFQVFDQASFVKKTNEKAADWSDVEAAIAALHADSSDEQTWRANLEARFDVAGFLRWLAVNTTMVNWDSYGIMTHNYYLYASPSLGGRLTWIPWDHNEALQSQRGPMAQGQSAEAELFHASAGSRWPLISLLLADPSYRAIYREELANAVGGLFDTEAGAARLRAFHALISPYVVGEEGEQSPHTLLSSRAAFVDALEGPSGLVAHLAARHARVEAALAAPAP